MAEINSFQQPINYAIEVQSPFEAALDGLKIGANIADIQAQRAAAQAQVQQQQALGEAMRGLTDKIRLGTASSADFQQIALLAPKEQSEAAMKIWESLSQDRQQNVLSFGSQVMAALGSKNPQIGVDLLKQRADGERNNGNEEQAKAYETWARLAELDPANSQATIGGLMQGIPGGDKAIEAWTKVQQERRVQELQPFKLSQETADALIKEAEAKFAPDKFGAELGLTQAQINQANQAAAAHKATAANSGAEAKQMAAGIIPADKRPEAESKFRKEYSEQTKGYQEVKSAYGRVLSSEDSAVGDLSLIFGYMKMLDPGSVVREGEFATAQNAAGVPERIQNIYNKVISGERLSPSQRASFKGQAGKLYSTAQTQEATVRDGIGRIAKGYGLNTANIFYTPTEEAPQPPAAPVSVTAPNGQLLTFPNQQAADAFKKAAGIR